LPFSQRRKCGKYKQIACEMGERKMYQMAGEQPPDFAVEHIRSAVPQGLQY
jgi:hypothetical protein